MNSLRDENYMIYSKLLQFSRAFFESSCLIKEIFILKSDKIFVKQVFIKTEKSFSPFPPKLQTIQEIFFKLKFSEQYFFPASQDGKPKCQRDSAREPQSNRPNAQAT